MDKPRKKAFVRTISTEIYSSLPGKRRISPSLIPVDHLDIDSGAISTSAVTEGRIIRNWEFVVGTGLWLGWLVFGTYFWWFTDVPTLHFILPPFLWIFILGFSIFGIPIVRALLEIKNKT